jgi:hypothetical protein
MCYVPTSAVDGGPSCRQDCTAANGTGLAFAMGALFH